MLLAPHTPAAAAVQPDVQPARRAQAGQSAAALQIDWQGTVVIQSEEREDSFAIGPDGCVWNFVRLQGEEPQLLPTGLKASSFAAARDEQDRLVVFAAHGMQLQVAAQQLGASSPKAHWNPRACEQWSKPVALQLPSVPHAISIARVSCEGQGSHLHVGAMLLCQRPQMAEHFELATSRWPKDGTQLQRFHNQRQAWVNSWQELLMDLRHLAESTQQARTTA